MDALMPIGRFARACRLSVKALRLYDEERLLRPHLVDVRTGYRYYHRDQARAAVAIGLLRALDVPLAVIRQVLATDEPAALERILARERDRVARELAQKQQALRSLERIIAAGELMPYDVTIRDEPPRTVLTLRATTAPEHDVEVTTALIARLIASAERQGVAWREVLSVLPGALDDLLVVEACLTLDGPFVPDDDATVAVLPGGPAAVARHTGPYEELGLAHFALQAWLQERGHEASGPVREIYVNDPASVTPAEIVTDVVVPI